MTMDLDQAYDNVRAVANFPAIYAGFQTRSQQTYANHTWQRDLAYGPLPRNRLDWFAQPITSAPTFIFIHGGYWQNCTKEDFAFVAEGPIAAGFNVALVEYTLAPEANLTSIAAEIRSLLDYLMVTKQLLRRRAPVILSGHSAGGHLSALHRDHPLVSHVMPISGLMELAPIRRCWLNRKLNLSESEVQALSPRYNIGAGAPMLITVGEQELPELVRQSHEYAQACSEAGVAVGYLPVPGCHHFSVLDDLACARGVQLPALLKRCLPAPPKLCSAPLTLPE